MQLMQASHSSFYIHLSDPDSLMSTVGITPASLRLSHVSQTDLRPVGASSPERSALVKGSRVSRGHSGAGHAEVRRAFQASAPIGRGEWLNHKTAHDTSRCAHSSHPCLFFPLLAFGTAKLVFLLCILGARPPSALCSEHSSIFVSLA